MPILVYEWITSTCSCHRKHEYYLLVSAACMYHAWTTILLPWVKWQWWHWINLTECLLFEHLFANKCYVKAKKRSMYKTWTELKSNQNIIIYMVYTEKIGAFVIRFIYKMRWICKQNFLPNWSWLFWSKAFLKINSTHRTTMYIQIKG